MHVPPFAVPVRAAVVLLLAFALVTPVVPAQSVAAVTRTVASTADDNTAGTLRYEIAHALPNDMISIQGVTGTIVLDAARGPLVLTQNVTITGPGAASIIISGNDAIRVFRVESGVTAAISGVTITRGFASGSDGYGGGGILNLGTLTVTACTISNNATGPGSVGTSTVPASAGGDGGGILSRGLLTVTGGSTISGNTTGQGGYNGSSSGGSGGEGGRGGGIATIAGNTFTLAGGSTVSGNRTGAGGNSNASGTGGVGGSGGGIFAYSAQAVIDMSTISTNIAGNGGTGINQGGAGGSGGGIYTTGSASLTVRGSTIRDNTSGTGNSGFGGAGGVGGDGGGITSTNVLSVTDSTISGNTTGNGGGGGTTNGGNGGNGGGIAAAEFARIARSIIKSNATGAGGAGNTANGGSNGGGGDGGGIYAVVGVGMTVSGSAISSNTTGGAGSVGGGIANSGFTTVTGSTFSANTAVRGGGGLYNDSTLTLGNDTISGNVASGVSGGGGILTGGTFTARNISVIGNNALATSFGGGGIRQASGTVDIANSLLTGNTTNVGGKDYHVSGGTSGDHGNNFVTDASPTSSFAFPSDIYGNTMPMIGALADNGGIVTLPDGSHPQTHVLLSGSPALNAGNNFACAASPVNNLDQRGVTRPKGGTCDIGAFELLSAPTLAPTSYPVGTAGGRATLTGTNLESVTQVTVDGTAVTGAVSSGGGTQLSVPIPAHAAGTMVAIVLTNPDTSAGGASGTLVYRDPNATPVTHTPAATTVSIPAVQPMPTHPVAPLPSAGTPAPMAQPTRH